MTPAEPPGVPAASLAGASPGGGEPGVALALEHKLAACELVALEAQLLDEQRWDDWLALYVEDALLWVPTWKDEATPTSDPSRELSFMVLRGRAQLVERVRRIRSGRSVASTPVARTTHLVAGAVASAGAGGRVTVKSAWTCHAFHHKDAVLTTLAGRYEHGLVPADGGWRIASKKILLTNDLLESAVDFFHL